MNGDVIIQGFVTAADATKHDDAGETVVIAALRMDAKPMAEIRAYKLTRAGGVTEIGRAAVGGKDNSGSAIIYRDGTVRLVVSEADRNPDGSSAAGSTSKVRVYDFPNALPPAVAAGGSSGASTDDEARRQVAQLRAEMQAVQSATSQVSSTLNGLGLRVAALEKKLGAPAVSLDEQRVKDIIWNGPTIDRVWAELAATTDNGLKQVVRGLAHEQIKTDVPSVLDQRQVLERLMQLEERVTQVSKTLDTLAGGVVELINRSIADEIAKIKNSLRDALS